MSFLNCTEFQARLQTAIEHRRFGIDVLDAEDPLQRHAAGCRTCRRDLQRELMVTEAVESWRADTPSVDLIDSVITGLRNPASGGEVDLLTDDPPSVSRSNRSTRPGAESMFSSPARQSPSAVAGGRGMLAIVAAVLIGAVAVWLAVPDRPESARIAADNPAGRVTFEPRPRELAAVSPEESPVAAAESVALGGALADAGTAWAALAREAAGAVSGTRMLLPRPAVPTQVEFDSPAVTARPEWTVGWDQDLEPLREQVDQAFGFLLDALPDTGPTAG